MAARNIASAKKFAAGQITGEQYLADGKARAAEFLAETEQGRQALERERLQEQCNRITTANPWIPPGLQAAALEKLRNLGCLR
jgi:ubiquinone biosynthesis protein UbiJ